MTECHNCKKKIEGLPFKCRHCNKYFCGECRLPEHHNCKEFTKYAEELKKNFLKPIKKYSPIKTKEIFDVTDNTNIPTEIKFKEPKKKNKIKKNNNEWSEVRFLFWVIVGILLIAFVISNSNTEDGNNNSYNTKINYEPVKNEKYFYYYDSLPITYYFNNKYKCEGDRKERVLNALKIIEKETNGTISFIETQDNGDIEINCYGEYLGKKIISEDGTVRFTQSTESTVAGEGGIESYVGDFKIQQGFVYLYKRNINYKYCYNYPDVELHELLHAFGFGHIDDSNSIMNEEGSCTNKQDNFIDEDIVECLKLTYSGNKNSFCKFLPTIYN